MKSNTEQIIKLNLELKDEEIIYFFGLIRYGKNKIFELLDTIDFSNVARDNLNNMIKFAELIEKEGPKL